MIAHCPMRAGQARVELLRSALPIPEPAASASTAPAALPESLAPAELSIGAGDLSATARRAAIRALARDTPAGLRRRAAK